MTILDTWKCFCSIKIITHNENILFPRDIYFNLYMFLFVILYIVLFFLENFISDKIVGCDGNFTKIAINYFYTKNI